MLPEVPWPGVADQGSSQTRRAWTWCPWTPWEAAETREERMCPYRSLIGSVQRWWRGASQPSKHRGLPVWAERKVGPEPCLPEVQPEGQALGHEGGAEGLLQRALGQAGVRSRISGLASCANTSTKNRALQATGAQSIFAEQTDE